MVADRESSLFRSTLLPIDDQWLVVAVLAAGAVLAESSVAALARLPLDLGAFLAATPDTWLPLAAVLTLIAGALALERQRPVDGGRWRWPLLIATAVAGGVWFYRAGDIDWYATQDWIKEWTYHAAVAEGLDRRRLPWFLVDTFQHTTRYFANPETNVAPWLVLLAWLDVSTFVVAQAAVFVAAGVWAISRLARDLALGPVAALTFVMVFLLNGHLIAHLETGHGQWVTYFLFPFVLLFVHRAAIGRAGESTPAALALTLALMVLAGGWHVFMWSVMFVTVFVLGRRDRWGFGVRTALLAAGLMAVRLLPALALYDPPPAEFVGSYRDLSLLAAGLVGEARRAVNGLNWWEYNAFVGWMGFVAVAAGVAAPLGRIWSHSVSALWAPSAALLALSTYDLYAWTLFRLPGFESQRVATRLFVVALLGFTLIACVQLNAWLARDRLSRRRLAALALAGALLAAQLVAHANSRRPRPDRQLGPPAVHLIDDRRPDALYTASVATGAAISLATAAVVFRPGRRRPAGP